LGETGLDAGRMLALCVRDRRCAVSAMSGIPIRTIAGYRVTPFADSELWDEAVSVLPAAATKKPAGEALCSSRQARPALRGGERCC